MSHQTGIQANEELRNFFGRCKDGNVRMVKVNIENEELSLCEYTGPSNDKWEDDYEDLILPVIEEGVPSYILFRLDTKVNSGYEWLLFFWSPESSSVRHKMLYASTKATLKMEFGAGQIKEEVFATSFEEASWKGYLSAKRNRDAPVPLTMAEEELAEIKKTETYADISIDSRHQTLQGVSFPLTQPAIDALKKFQAKKINYIQLKIDLDKELIHLVSVSSETAESIGRKIPDDTPRYHIFNFPHTHEGDYLESCVFIYSMPGYACSIKERMLYSSCKGPLIAGIESTFQIIMDKKLEIESGKELSGEFLLEELHPTKSLNRPKFAKPKGPPNRGAKRLTKVNPTESFNI